MNFRVITKPRNYDVITRFRNYVTTLVERLVQELFLTERSFNLGLDGVAGQDRRNAGHGRLLDIQKRGRKWLFGTIYSISG
jgi:hypothetical protein